jgi:hypothetical protein
MSETGLNRAVLLQYCVADIARCSLQKVADYLAVPPLLYRCYTAVFSLLFAAVFGRNMT